MLTDLHPMTTNNPTTLRDETRHLLNNRPVSLSLEAIGKEIDVSVSWLRSFSKGKIENPGVVTICALKELLQKVTAKV